MRKGIPSVCLCVCASVLVLAPLGGSDDCPVDAQVDAEDGCDGNALNAFCEQEIVIDPKVSCNLSDGEQPAPCSPSPDTATCCSRLQSFDSHVSIVSAIAQTSDIVHQCQLGADSVCFARRMEYKLAVQFRRGRI